MTPVVDSSVVRAAASAAAKASAEGDPAATSAPASDAAAPAAVVAGGTPATPATPTDPKPADGASSVESLPKLVQKAIAEGKFKLEDFSFLDAKFEPAFTTRLNKLNRVVEKAVTEAGITLPEGTSVHELLYRDDGKPFLELIRQTVAGAVKPVTDRVTQADADDAMRGQLVVAKKNFPLVARHFEKSLEIVDTNPELLALAMRDNGADMPWVLAGVAESVENEKLRERVAQYETLLREADVLVQVGDKSTKVGGGAPPAEQPQAQKLSGLRDMNSIRAIAAGIAAKRAAGALTN
jgi:hypothetical protein